MCCGLKLINRLAIIKINHNNMDIVPNSTHLNKYAYYYGNNANLTNINWGNMPWDILIEDLE